jgi:hypothetical protein
MKQITKFLVGFLVLVVLCSGIVSAASFTMQVKNATTGGCIAMDGGNTVYRGDTVCFTDTSGGSSWEWNFGDGFTSTEQNPEHTYAFGKRPIVMHNGYINLGISLKASDGSIHEDTIKFSTLLPPIVTAQETIALMNETLAENYTEALTGNRTAPPGWNGFDWVRGITTTEEAYTSVLGSTIFLILVFSIPFIMNWIIMKDFVVAGILGGFLGIYIIVRLPANMQLLAVGFIVMSAVAVIYSLLKET